MKNNNAIIITLGVFIISIFSIVIAKNLLPESTTKYYSKPDEIANVKIEEITKEKDMIKIKISGEPAEYCIKTTKSTPSNNSICYNKITNNYIEAPGFSYKKYYIWIKDKNNKVTERIVISEG